jgi:predicted acylesterase/phospholipase RssA
LTGLPPAQATSFVYALSGGGALGSFEVGAMLCMSPYPGLYPVGIAATSVGAINAIAAAEASLAGFQKMKHSWLALKNQRDMYVWSSWVDEVNRLSGLHRAGIHFKAALAATGHVEYRDADDPRAVTSAISSLKRFDVTGLITQITLGSLLLSPLNLFFDRYIDTPSEIVDEIRDACVRALEIMSRSTSQGVYSLLPMAATLSANLDTEAIARAGTKIRLVSVNVEDGDIYYVDERLQILRVSARGARGQRAVIIGQNARPPGGGVPPLAVASLASASIPFATPPLMLTFDLVPGSHGSTVLSLVDGGVREVLPVAAAADIVERDFSSRPGRKCIVAIGAGAVAQRPTDVFFPELQAAPGGADTPWSQANALDILGRSLDLALDETTAAELRWAYQGLPDSVDFLEIVPTFSVGNSSSLDPGLIQIGLAYGYMTAFDRLRQRKETTSEDAYRAGPWTSTSLIVQLRYLCWLLEREGDCVIDLAKNLEVGATRGWPEDTVLKARPDIAAWVFNRDSRVAEIRRLKRLIADRVHERIRSYGLSSIPSVDDLSSFDNDNNNCVADWWFEWERHAVAPDTERPPSFTGLPEGVGLASPTSNTVRHFARTTTPWSAQLWHNRSLRLAVSNLRRMYHSDYYNPRALRGAGETDADYERRLASVRERYNTPLRALINEVHAVAADVPPSFELVQDGHECLVGCEGYAFRVDDGSRPSGALPLLEVRISRVSGPFGVEIGPHVTPGVIHVVQTLATLELLTRWRLQSGVAIQTVAYVHPAAADGLDPLFFWHSDRHNGLTSSAYRFWTPKEPAGLRQIGGAFNRVGDGPLGFVFSPHRPQPRGSVSLVRFFDKRTGCFRLDIRTTSLPAHLLS